MTENNYIANKLTTLINHNDKNNDNISLVNDNNANNNI